MKWSVARAVVSISILVVCNSLAVHSQQPSPSAEDPTLRVQSSLVLVDVISQDPKSGLPVRDFKKEDFRVFDNGHEVQIATFDMGTHHDTRPISLWLAVLCNEGETLWPRQNLRRRNPSFGPHLII